MAVTMKSLASFIVISAAQWPSMVVSWLFQMPAGGGHTAAQGTRCQQQQQQGHAMIDDAMIGR